VLVDGSPRVSVTAGTPVPIFLAPYKRYEIAIKPASSDQPLASVQASVREVTLYPGNVQTLRWNVEPITVVFGRLVDAAGAPVANAAIDGAVGTAETDSQGYFQAEINKQKSLKVRTLEGKTCNAVLPELRPKEGLARVGALACR
jgi:outer membrane usher protein FimD/PapC